LKTLLQGHKFTVETDHKNIVHIMGSTEGRLARWRLLFQDLDFSVQHIPGGGNIIADALSRCLVAVDKEDEIRTFFCQWTSWSRQNNQNFEGRRSCLAGNEKRCYKLHSWLPLMSEIKIDS
jgi:hypothetical protein